MLKKSLTQAIPFAVALTAAFLLGGTAQAQTASPGTTDAGTTGAGATDVAPAGSTPADPGLTKGTPVPKMPDASETGASGRTGTGTPDSDTSSVGKSKKGSTTKSSPKAGQPGNANMPDSTPAQTNLNRNTGEGNVTGPSPVTGTEGSTVNPGSKGGSVN